ncbi:glutamine--tRNA ligase/YqeY domain fusion protein [Deltaproteobacteria bacterium TL4]
MSDIISTNFIRNIIDKDLETHKYGGRVMTRFPPEPNGYLHIGHAKSICLNFGIAADYNGHCYLRFDDTNPDKESVEYVESIKENVKWLGFDWGHHLTYASDYFEQLYQYATTLIQRGKAYICGLNAEEIRQYRGTLTEPGKESPYRDRGVEENLALFERMRSGEFADGMYVLRAKIDMSSPNINMRDPAIYRIRHSTHHRTGDQWCIYPMYDFTHCLCDALEGITHSLCTLEFEDHRPLYDWFLETLSTENRPQQIEFSRLFLEYTVTSKRKLNELVVQNYVEGWDDPRMPTISGLRRRGYTPASIQNFCNRVGISKSESNTTMTLLEDCLREDLDKCAPRAMGVLNPLKVVIDNYPENQTEELEAHNHPKDESKGTRKVPFSKVLYIEKEDFMEEPPKNFFRLALGREVRLRYAYLIQCHQVIKEETTGEIVELRCTYDPLSKGGKSSDGRKVKGIIHWVSSAHAISAEIRQYDRLFIKAIPDGDQEEADYKSFLNPHSLEIIKNAQLEPTLADALPQVQYQFERQGYFMIDAKSSSQSHLVFNRIVTLRDSWSKMEKS